MKYAPLSFFVGAGRLLSAKTDGLPTTQPPAEALGRVNVLRDEKPIPGAPEFRARLLTGKGEPSAELASLVFLAQEKGSPEVKPRHVNS